MSKLGAPGPAKVEIREWPVPWRDTRPRDPAVDGKGRVWFVGQTGDYVGWLDPGKSGRFDLEDGAGPHNVIVGPGGDLWVAGNRKGWIGRMDPASGKLQKFPGRRLPVRVAPRFSRKPGRRRSGR